MEILKEISQHSYHSNAYSDPYQTLRRCHTKIIVIANIEYPPGEFLDRPILILDKHDDVTLV